MANARQLVLAKAQELWPDDPRSQNYFAALAQQESGFNPSAHNTRGEDSYGLFQFGPDMRRAYGLDLTSGMDAQVSAAGDYLKGLYDKYNGDWGSVLAEHNLGIPKFNRMQAGGTDPAIERFRNNHLPAVEAIARGGNMANTDVTALVDQGGQGMGGFEELFKKLSPELQAKFMEALASSFSQMGNLSGINPMQAQQPVQPTQDPRVLMGLLGQGDQRGGALTDPRAGLNQLYPGPGMPGGPQSGYIQWLGGSMQNPEPAAKTLAIQGLVQNLLTGWQDAQKAKRQQQEGG